MEYLIAFFIAIGLNMALFVPAYVWKTDKLTDLSYALSFLIIAVILFSMSSFAIGHVLLMTMIALWAIRLGAYLFIRIRKMDRDPRFDGMRENFLRFGKFWFLQGMSVFLILTSSIPYFATENADLSQLSIIGICIWLVGLLAESIADYQKYVFINDPAHKGQWIDRGLWHYSRHPNYFGEITVWFGIYIFSFSALSTTDAFIAMISPLYITAIILFVSGIPLLEKSADKKWGDTPEYQKYKKSTSMLIPLPKKNTGQSPT